MKKLKIQSINKRKLVKKFEHFNYVTKLIRVNYSLNKIIYLNLNLINSSFLLKKSSKHLISNRCICSNKNSIISNYFRLSRFFFFKFSRFNSIYGVKKLFW